jgi:hypothetical protein
MPKPKVKLKSSLRSQRQRWCVAEPEIGDNQVMCVGRQGPRSTYYMLRRFKIRHMPNAAIARSRAPTAILVRIETIRTKITVLIKSNSG